MAHQFLLEHRKESGKKEQSGRFKEGKKVAGGSRTERGTESRVSSVLYMIPESLQTVLELTAPTALPKNTCVGLGFWVSGLGSTLS